MIQDTSMLASERFLAKVVSSAVVSTDENVFAHSGSLGASDLVRVTPHQLCVVAYVPDPARDAIIRKQPRLIMPLFSHPSLYTSLERIITFRSRPEVFSLWIGRQFRRVLECSRCGEMIGPTLRRLRQPGIPAQRRDAQRRSLPIVHRKDTDVED